MMLPVQGAPSGPPAPDSGLVYLRRCYASVLGWYKVADSKAQTIVTLNGLIVTVLTGTALASPDELNDRLGHASAVSLVSLTLAAVSVISALLCAVACLFSRLDGRRLRKMHGYDATEKPYPLSPEDAWWFGMIAILTSGDRRRRSDLRESDMSQFLLSADEQFEMRALASQIVVLSKNTLRKHAWVNHGWLATVAGLVFIVLFGASYAYSVLD